MCAQTFGGTVSCQWVPLGNAVDLNKTFMYIRKKYNKTSVIKYLAETKA